MSYIIPASQQLMDICHVFFNKLILFFSYQMVYKNVKTDIETTRKNFEEMLIQWQQNRGKHFLLFPMAPESCSLFFQLRLTWSSHTLSIILMCALIKFHVVLKTISHLALPIP